MSAAAARWICPKCRVNNMPDSPVCFRCGTRQPIERIPASRERSMERREGWQGIGLLALAAYQLTPHGWGIFAAAFLATVAIVSFRWQMLSLFGVKHPTRRI